MERIAQRRAGNKAREYIYIYSRGGCFSRSGGEGKGASSIRPSNV